MPTVKIELRKGRDHEALVNIMNLVMDAVVVSLQLPANDRNIRLIEYEPDFFQIKASYEIIVELSMFTGRTKETKRKLYQKIVTTLESEAMIERNKVLIILNEQPLENWGARGGIPADEIDLGFNVNV